MFAAKKRIGVVIPCYNTARHIEKVIRTLPDFVDRIFVVDDASTDGTSETAAGLRHPKTDLIRHAKNQGVGAAVMTGFRAASDAGMDILVKMDGDGQMRPEFLRALVEPLAEGRAHYAKGNRFTDAQFLTRMPGIRRFGNAWLSFFAKLVSGYWNVFDVTNGYTAILTATYRKVDPRAVARGYFFEISLLTELNIVGAKVADVDIPAFYGDEKSHLSVNKAAAFFPFLLLRAFFHRFYQRYIIRDFNVFSVCFLTGLPLFLFGVLYGLNLWAHPPVSGSPTPAGTVMLAALPIIIGFQLLLAALILDVVFVPNVAPHREIR